MAIQSWLPGATAIDLSGSHGYGPFQQPFLGVIVHVNQSNGNLANFFRNSNDVCPNFQVYKTGAIEQYLPINNQPWCQTAGNQQYAAIETEGFTTEPWTPAQLNSVAQIVSFYRAQMNLSMVLAESPGQNGIGWHGMGGTAWGNHPGCPGDLRKAQRQDAIDIVTGIAPSGGGNLEDDMGVIGFTATDDQGAGWYVSLADNTKVYCGDPNGVAAASAGSVFMRGHVASAELARIPSKDDWLNSTIAAIKGIPGGSSGATNVTFPKYTAEFTPEA